MIYMHLCILYCAVPTAGIRYGEDLALRRSVLMLVTRHMTSTLILLL